MYIEMLMRDVNESCRTVYSNAHSRCVRPLLSSSSLSSSSLSLFLSQRIVFRDPGLGEVVLMEGGPQTTPTYSTSTSGGHASAGGRSGGGEGGRSGRRGTGKSSQTGSSKSAGVKSALNPLAVVTPSGELQ